MEFDIAQAIKDFGFPIIAAMGMGYFIFFIWKWVTETIDPVIGESMVTLIKLVDRVRMLDNDMIRMNMKLAMVLEHKVLLDAKLNQEQSDELDLLISKYQSRSQVFDSTGQGKKTDAPKK
jgi:ABC-type molybdate transport system ATPase subunit